MFATGTVFLCIIELPLDSSRRAPVISFTSSNLLYLRVTPLTDVSTICKNQSNLYASDINLSSDITAFSLMSGSLFISATSKKSIVDPKSEIFTFLVTRC